MAGGERLVADRRARLHDGRRADHWGQFLEEYAPLYRRHALLPVVGNHEYANDFEHGMANFEAIFDYEPFYAVDMPNAALFVLNSCFLVDQHGLLEDDLQDQFFRDYFVSADTSATPSWLERELERRKDRPFKMVAMHHPMLTFSWHVEDWYDEAHGRDLLRKRRQLLDLFERYDVQVVFSNLMESAVGRAASAHLAAAHPEYPGPHGLATGAWLAEDIGPAADRIDNGRLMLHRGTGIGFVPGSGR